jgi:hypothetical protein
LSRYSRTSSFTTMLAVGSSGEVRRQLPCPVI